jgi:hypothetical protein
MSAHCPTEDSTSREEIPALLQFFLIIEACRPIRSTHAANNGGDQKKSLSRA